MRAFLVAASPQASAPWGLAPGPDDWVAAVDRGLLHARAWGWPVHLLIGDLDSLPASVQPARPGADAAPDADREDWPFEVITAPRAKDETDLEMALAEALRRGAHELWLCAALGGRSDHWLANVFLLARPELVALPVALVDGPASLRLLRGPGQMALAGTPGDLLSLLPLGGPAQGVTTTDLAYPLRAETLHIGEARGVSNVFSGPRAAVSLAGGQLLVYHLAGGEPA